MAIGLVGAARLAAVHAFGDVDGAAATRSTLAGSERGPQRAGGAPHRPEPAPLGEASRPSGPHAPPPAADAAPTHTLHYALPPGARRGPIRSPDLDVLRDIIELNGLTEASSLHDYDDGDGDFEPLELGDQVWRRGRLVELHSGPDAYTSFGYELRELPDSIGTLAALETLDLHTNRLERLPESIRFLTRLRRLRLQRNRLTELPDEVFGLAELLELGLSENALRELPESVEALDRLRVLHLRDNPLERLPEGMGRLAGVETLLLQRTDTAGPPALARLPAALADLRALRLLNVAGLSLNCVEPPPEFLVDGSVDRVYGLDRQRCPAAETAP